MEFGLFLALTALVGIGLARQSFLLLALSTAASFILAIYIAAEDVTLQQHSAAGGTIRDENGTLIKTATATEDQTINIFKENRTVMSYVFYALGCFSTLVFFRRVVAVVAPSGG